MPEKRIFTVAEVADMYGVSKPTVYKWFSQGLPKLKIDGICRIASEDLTEFEDKHRQVSKLTA